MTESPQSTARWAGGLWLMVIVLSILAIVLSPPFASRTTAAEIAARVADNELSLRVSFTALFLGGLCYIGVTALIYELLAPVNRRVALFGALAAVIGVAMGGATFIHQMNAISMISQSDLQTLAATYLRPGSDFSIGMAYFGCHIASTGYLILQSRLVPRLIGGILVVGGSTYILTSLAMLIVPASGAVLSPIVIPIALLGEGSLTLWLLIKGVRQPASNHRGSQ